MSEINRLLLFWQNTLYYQKQYKNEKQVQNIITLFDQRIQFLDVGYGSFPCKIGRSISIAFGKTRTGSSVIVNDMSREEQIAVLMCRDCHSELQGHSCSSA